MEKKISEQRIWCTPITHELLPEINREDMEFSIRSWAESISELGINAYSVQALSDYYHNHQTETIRDGIRYYDDPSYLATAILRFIYEIKPNLIINIIKQISEDYSPDLVPILLKPIINLLTYQEDEDYTGLER